MKSGLMGRVLVIGRAWFADFSQQSEQLEQLHSARSKGCGMYARVARDRIGWFPSCCLCQWMLGNHVGDLECLRRVHIASAEHDLAQLTNNASVIDGRGYKTFSDVNVCIFTCVYIFHPYLVRSRWLHLSDHRYLTTLCLQHWRLHSERSRRNW